MSKNKKKVTEDTSGKAALERGQEAIAAQEKLAEKKKGPEKAKAIPWHKPVSKLVIKRKQGAAIMLTGYQSYKSLKAAVGKTSFYE